MTLVSISVANCMAMHFLTWLPFSLQEHLYFFTRLNVSENATAKGVASTAPLVRSRPFVWPVVKKLCEESIRRKLFWLCLDQSTLIFRFQHLTFWQIFLKLTLSRSVHANFFFWRSTLWNFHSRAPEVQSSRGPELQSSRGPELQSSRAPELQRSSTLILQFFLWLNIDQAITLTSFVYETNIDFFYSWTFQHLFRRFDRDFSLTSEDWTSKIEDWRFLCRDISFQVWKQ